MAKEKKVVILKLTIKEVNLLTDALDTAVDNYDFDNENKLSDKAEALRLKIMDTPTTVEK